MSDQIIIANPVRFIYVSSQGSLPESRDPDAVYFVEAAQEIWVGDKLLANNFDDSDIETFLEPYKVKTVEIVGDGSVLASANFNEVTGQLTLTKGTAAHPDSGTGEPRTWGGDDPLDLIHNIQVDKYGHISDVNTINLRSILTDLVHQIINDDPNIAKIEDIPTWTIE